MKPSQGEGNIAILPLNQGDIKYVTLEPVRHQICNPLDSFDLRCESVHIHMTIVDMEIITKSKLCSWQ